MEVTAKLVHQHADALLDSEISQYWVDSAIGVPVNLVPERLREVIAIARDESGKLVGVATVKVIWVPRLKNWFHTFRVSVAKDARGSVLHSDPNERIESKLFYLVLNHLENTFDPNSADAPIGFYINIANPKLNAVLNSAVEPQSGLTFLGYNVDGEQVHIKYYPGAQIGHASPPNLS